MNIQPWSTEDPNLYVARLELKDPEGKTVQSRETRIGFRTIEFFPQDGVYLNGTKLVVKGVNRHSFSVDGGRATSAAMSRQDALLVKEMNMNAVRSHYPPDEHFLDMCDSLGIVYMDELAGWQNGYDSKVGPKLVKEMIERDVNHPSIIIWSNGNEGGWNYNLDPLFAKYDKLQKRHMVHPWADFNDLDTHHYPTYLTGVARFTNGYKVFMLPNSCMPCTIREAVPDCVTFGIVGARTLCLPEALSGYSVTKPPNVLIKEAYWILINPMLLTG